MGDEVGATGERFLDANVRRLRGPLDEEWVIGDRASSMTPESGRAGAGEEERLAGRKKDGVLRACMVYIRTGRVLCNKIGGEGVCSGQVRMNEPLLSVQISYPIDESEKTFYVKIGSKGALRWSV